MQTQKLCHINGTKIKFIAITSKAQFWQQEPNLFNFLVAFFSPVDVVGANERTKAGCGQQCLVTGRYSLGLWPPSSSHHTLNPQLKPPLAKKHPSTPNPLPPCPDCSISVPFKIYIFHVEGLVQVFRRLSWLVLVGRNASRRRDEVFGNGEEILCNDLGGFPFSGSCCTWEMDTFFLIGLGMKVGRKKNGIIVLQKIGFG